MTAGDARIVRASHPWSQPRARIAVARPRTLLPTYYALLACWRAQLAAGCVHSSTSKWLALLDRHLVAGGHPTARKVPNIRLQRVGVITWRVVHLFGHCLHVLNT